MNPMLKGLLAAGLVASAGLVSAPVLAQRAPAMAQDAGFYLGGAVGQSRLKDACEGLTIACDEKDTGWKVFAGYQFNRYLGIEGGYVDLGKASASGTITGVGVTGNAEVKGWELLGVGTLPIANNFSAYGKVGFFRWDLDVSATAVVPGFAVSTSASDDGTDMTFGVGLKYEFTRNVAARLEWQRYNDIGGSNTGGKSDVDLFSLGVVFKF